MVRAIYFFTILTSLIVVSVGVIDIKGYYWREYAGVVPSDAVPGGTDRTGEPIYIGQTLFEENIVPGKIYNYERQIRFAFHEAENIHNTNIKILCSQTPQNFVWTPSSATETTKSDRKKLVKGGYQPGLHTYIGRAFQNGETTVGKVMCYVSGECRGFWSAHNGKPIFEPNAYYEILSYEE